MTNYALLLAIWLICYIGPAMAGPWYDGAHFNFLQSSVSLFLILCAIPFRQFWWIRSFCVIALMQIFLNVADYFGNVSIDGYNTLQLILNSIEFALLFVVGLIAQGVHYASDNLDLNRRNSRSSEGSRR